MNIIRKIKLEQLGYYTCIDNKEKEMFQFLRNFIELLPYKIECYGFNNSILYYQKDKFIFYYDYGTMWINKDLNYDKIKSDYINKLMLKILAKFNFDSHINICVSACNQQTINGYTKYKID